MHAEIEKKVEARLNQRRRSSAPSNDIELEKEPQLTIEQIEEIENKIGARLIEEVIEVVEGELKFIETQLKTQVWKDLKEKKQIKGQWTYFMRDSGTPTVPYR
ncbi:hypothetical protein DL95DRAFT_414381 [Leptodontidium sp. 2 PMI_412]|nr:hypothetical protein DL95DRAFT_414381 [Leptodontidium sp. 2 PMI_412]